MRGPLKVVAALVLTILAGCGKDSVLGVGETTATGSYILRTINGDALPATIQKIGSDSTEVLNETLVLADGAIFSISGASRVTEGGVSRTESYDLDGTYTLNATALILTFSTGGRESGTVSGGTLTLTSGGFTLVYRK